MPATYVVKNVSGEGNACFFRALTKSFGDEFIRELLNIQQDERITAATFRKVLSYLYLTSYIIKNQIEISLEIINAIPGISANEIANLTFFTLPIAKCIHSVLNDPNIKSKEVRVKAILQCCAEAIKQDIMVSQLEVRTIQHMINENLSTHNKILVVLTIEAGKLIEDNYIAKKMLDAFKDIIIKIENNTIIYDASKTVHFIATDNSHYRYIVKKEDNKEIAAIPLDEILAYGVHISDGLTATQILKGVNSPTEHSVGFGGSRKGNKARKQRV